MKLKKLESGRSMVEMLGVLAIIGVLSVGGIAGYSLSMRRHRANGVVDLVSKYALVVYGECQKRVLDGLDSTFHCHNSSAGTEALKFDNAGVGSLPAGVTAINFRAIENLVSDGVEHIRINITFSDAKLCQAVASIAGDSCLDNKTSVLIKQN